MCKCKKCTIELTDSNWYLSKQALKQNICKKCCNILAQTAKNNGSCSHCSDKLISGYNWNRYLEKVNVFCCKDCDNIMTRFRRDRLCRLRKIPRQVRYNKAQQKIATKMRTKIGNFKEKHSCITSYGGKCVCCGTDEWTFLSVDHINNNGNEERRKHLLSGVLFYRYLRQQKYPSDNYQLLCFNCNSAKGYHGFCPHNLTQSSLCHYCASDLGDNQFSFNKIFGHNICKGCIMNFSRGSSCMSDKKIKAKEYTLNIKKDIIIKYGGKCVCCGEAESYFLGIDHINGGGESERKSGLRGAIFYRWLKKNNYPKDNYQLLCFNCNSCKGSYGKCCHQHDRLIDLSQYQSIITDSYRKKIEEAA